jgi:hypothetical protein
LTLRILLRRMSLFTLLYNKLHRRLQAKGSQQTVAAIRDRTME